MAAHAGEEHGVGAGRSQECVGATYGTFSKEQLQ
jgi:hypothetical protein